MAGAHQEAILGWEGCQEPRCFHTAPETQLGRPWLRQQADGESPKVARGIMKLLLGRTTKKCLAPCSFLVGSEAKEKKRLLSLEVSSNFAFLQQQKPDAR